MGWRVLPMPIPPLFMSTRRARCFRAMATAIFLVTRQWRALMWFALAAIVMPLSDALQVVVAQGPPLVIARHLAIAAYLAVTAVFLNRLVA
jgi:hypothetical protein